MEREAISPRFLRHSISVITVLGNVLGGVVTFVYFAYVEFPLVNDKQTEAIENASSDLLDWSLFVICMAIIVVPMFISSRRLLAPVFDNLEHKINTWEPEGLNMLVGKILDTPYMMASRSLVAWISAALIFSFLPPSYQVYHKDLEVAFKCFIGIVLVGAPFTLVYIYFVLEWWLRKNLVKLFPMEALRKMPPSKRLRVLPKMTSVCLMISVLPLTIISYTTLNQIYAIDAGRQTIDSFLAHMPAVIGFIFFIGLFMALELSFLMSRSISDPLKIAEKAMDKMGRGDFNVTAPILCNDEIGALSAGFNRMVEGLQERDRIKETFGRYISEEVAKEILRSPDSVKLGGELRHMTVLVSDLRGFTHMADTLGPEKTLKVINRHLGLMTEIILDHGGTIDEIAGDGILVFFGAPKAMEDHTLRAVKCALDMQKAMSNMNQENLSMGLPQLQMGIGINCGELVVGNIGSEKRKKYGAMGTPINVAFRVEAKTGAGEVLVTEDVKERLDNILVIQNCRNLNLKGLDGEKTVYLVVGLNGAQK